MPIDDVVDPTENGPDLDIISIGNFNKENDTYSLVKLNEVIKGGKYRGSVLRTIIQKNFWTLMKLDGGYIESTNLCIDKEDCLSKKLKFAVKPDESNTNDIMPEYAIIKRGNYFYYTEIYLSDFTFYEHLLLRIMQHILHSVYNYRRHHYHHHYFNNYYYHYYSNYHYYNVQAR